MRTPRTSRPRHSPAPRRVCRSSSSSSARDDDPRFIVSKIIPELVTDRRFVEGVELIEWNGVPIADAVRRRGESERGGRPDSAMARALDSLTFRPLGIGPPPDERWIIVGYRQHDDAPIREHRFEWRFILPGPPPDAAHPTAPAAAANAIHPDRALVRRAKKLSFNADLWRSERRDRVAAAGVGIADNGWITGQFQDNVSARVVDIGGRGYGYLRLWSFEISDDDGFIAEVVRLLAALPQDGLIIDLRGNPGGLIWAAERLLQLFTPFPIAPTRFSIIASDLTREMTDAPQNRRSLSPWRRTLLEAVGTGEVYSQSVPITPTERCNDIGQVYGGPVIAVVDSTTYSAADLFAAGFADNAIGTVVCVGRATGAGGANVWWADTLNSVLAGTHDQLPRLPKGVGFTLSVRRATRIGASDGAPIEDIGIVGHRPYAMTRDDLLQRQHRSADLLRAVDRIGAGNFDVGAVDCSRPRHSSQPTRSGRCVRRRTSTSILRCRHRNTTDDRSPAGGHPHRGIPGCEPATGPHHPADVRQVDIRHTMSLRW